MNIKTAVKYTRGQLKRLERAEKVIEELFYTGFAGCKRFETLSRKFYDEIVKQYGKQKFDDYIKYKYDLEG